jgi:NADP-reducing hydrogenase subunit HndB
MPKIEPGALDGIAERMKRTMLLREGGGSAGLCSREPMITVELQGKPAVKYVDMTPEKAKQVFAEHVLGGKIVTEYALAAGSERTL